MTFYARRAGKHNWLIRVSDTGNGIPEEELPHIFQPYYTCKKDGNHFGLGLSYCEKVIQKHGGTIHVNSSARGSGKGTVFSLYLPDREWRRRK